MRLASKSVLADRFKLKTRIEPRTGRYSTRWPPVTDRTGLYGLYDFELRWSGPPENPNPNDPTEFITAVREQLGLQPQSARGPVDFLVIVSAEQPQVDE